MLEVLVGAPRGYCAWLLLALVVSSLPSAAQHPGDSGCGHCSGRPSTTALVAWRPSPEC